MNLTDFRKRLVRALARNGLYLSSWFIIRLPYSMVRKVTHFFIAVGYMLTARQKRIARESLKIAFGQEKTEQEIKTIMRACFENLGQGMIQLIYFMAHPRYITEKVEVEGAEHLQAALKEGKGVIAVSAHFGNFPLMLLYYAQKGYATNAIIRPTRDEKIEAHFQQQRSSLGLNTIYAVPRRECVQQSIKVLRNNEILFIPLDQNFGSGRGVFVDFFGQKAATATGPVVFAKRTGAPILPMFIVRDQNDMHKVIIEPPMHLEEGLDDDDTIYKNVARITRVIEKYIRRYPHEWGWMHRRWKSRPKTEHAHVP